MEKLKQTAKKMVEIVGWPTIFFAVVCFTVLLVTSFVPPENLVSMLCRKK